MSVRRDQYGQTEYESTNKVYYNYQDRLGSTSAVADGNGVIPSRGRMVFDAFGMAREANFMARYRVGPEDATVGSLMLDGITDRGFTGHQHLDALQLIHMNGRAYDFRLGRFLSVDPIIQFPANSQSLNPYSYILNNPLSGTDPTGYQVSGDSVCARGADVCGAAYGTDGISAMEGQALVTPILAIITVRNGADSQSITGAGGRGNLQAAVADKASAIVSTSDHFSNIGCEHACRPSRMSEPRSDVELPSKAQTAEFGISLTGVGGTAISAYELIMGESPLTGESASRAWAAVGLIPFGRLLKYGGKAVHAGEEIVEKAATTAAKKNVEIVLGIGNHPANRASPLLERFAQKVGGVTYGQFFGSWWPGSIEALQSNIKYFIRKADLIHFNLDQFSMSDYAKWLSNPKFEIGSVTNWELRRVLSNPKLLMKTIFYGPGGAIIDAPK